MVAMNLKRRYTLHSKRFAIFEAAHDGARAIEVRALERRFACRGARKGRMTLARGDGQLRAVAAQWMSSRSGAGAPRQKPEKSA